MKTTTFEGGTSVTLDIEELTSAQGMILAETIAFFLVTSGQCNADFAFTGPHLVQFLTEAAKMAQQRREERLTEALDEIHRWIDASDRELADAGQTRAEVLTHARALREAVDPADLRALRQAS